MALILWCNGVSYFLLSRMLTLPLIFAARFMPFDGLGEHGGEVAQLVLVPVLRIVRWNRQFLRSKYSYHPI